MAERSLLQRFAVWLATVTAVDVGRPRDGLTILPRSGTSGDPTWADLSASVTEARRAFTENALARRIVNLLTAYVVADGVQLICDGPRMGKWIGRFTEHEMNRLLMRQAEWCRELSLAGEVFVTLHLNPADGMSYVRLIPAEVIDTIQTAAGDYEHELSYHEVVGREDPDYAEGGRTWLAPGHPDADKGVRPGPVMLHFVVNRQVGRVRGESDLGVVLVWLKRYTRWLEDRVRLNAAVRSFLWIVTVPERVRQARQAEYATPPEAGSVIVQGEGEKWEAVAPQLQGHDVSYDGRAVRWMIVAGGPGIGLVDLGEAETANLATARAMGEQRLRFMAQRQGYFGFLLSSVAVTAYNRAVRLGFVRGTEVPVSAVRAVLPDLSAMDNAEFGQAASALADALGKVAAMGVGGLVFRKWALRLVAKFAGEQLAQADLDAMVVSGDAVVEGESPPSDAEQGAAEVEPPDVPEKEEPSAG